VAVSLVSALKVYSSSLQHSLILLDQTLSGRSKQVKMRTQQHYRNQNYFLGLGASCSLASCPCLQQLMG
jgi:hypothetical protein